jgi:HlyD family secretion protein
MDKHIQPKNQKLKRVAFMAIPVALVIGLVSLNLTHKKQVNLNREKLAIKTVSSGDFEDVVLLNSTIVPKTTVLINVLQGGSVAEVFAESGQLVKKGDLLLRIFNPNAELNYLTQETAITEQINNLQNIRINIKNQQLTLQEQLLSIEDAYKKAQRQYLMDTTLFNEGVIAKNMYDASVQEFEYQSKRNKAISKSIAQEEVDRAIQLKRINNSIQNMERSLEMLRKNKENFLIRAPVNGLLSSFNPLLGENYPQGQNIAKIDVLEGFKLLADADEYYISKLNTQLKGMVTLNSQQYPVIISKIHPEVVGGQFQMELRFMQDSIPYAKRGMNLKTKVFLSNNSAALLLPKGMFYQSTNGNWVFVLNTEHQAVKRNIRIGRENPFYYEILEGLEVGDQVITSDYKGFEDVVEINIK